MRSAARISSHPIHTILVAFPIGLFVCGFVFDLIAVSLGKPPLWGAGWYCIMGGLVGGVSAAIPGAIDWLRVVPPKSSAASRGLLHGGLNALMLVLFLVVAVMRGSADAEPGTLPLLLQACGVVLLGCSGWLGGTLVVRNQIGVDHRYANAGKFRESTLSGYDQPVCNRSELAEGQMMLAHVNNKRIVVAHCPDGYAAFADRCTHSGGPLSDGALVGCTVQCPWHGSQFDVNSGRVVAGPAQRHIATYEVEIKGGEVYVAPTREKKAA